MEAIEILGVRVDRVDMAGTLRVLEDFITAGRPRLVITLGTEMVMAARRNPELGQLINQADLVVADTVGILWASRRQGVPLPERVAGIDLIHALARHSSGKGWSIYLLGGKEGVAADAARRLGEMYPGLRIAGSHPGFFADDQSVVNDIRDSAPAILLLGLGFPRQEMWFQRHRESLGVPVGIGVGGSFDVLAGRIGRAPAWMIGLGLEWLYRLIRQPRRVIRMLALPRFVLAVLTGREGRREPGR